MTNASRDRFSDLEDENQSKATSRLVHACASSTTIPKMGHSLWLRSRDIWSRDLPTDASGASNENVPAFDDHLNESDDAFAGAVERSAHRSIPLHRQSYRQAFEKATGEDPRRASAAPTLQTTGTVPRQSLPPPLGMHSLPAASTPIGNSSLDTSQEHLRPSMEMSRSYQARLNTVPRQLSHIDTNRLGTYANCRLYLSDRTSGQDVPPGWNSNFNKFRQCSAPRSDYKQLDSLLDRSKGFSWDTAHEPTIHSRASLPSPISPHDTRDMCEQELDWTQQQHAQARMPQSSAPSSIPRGFDGLSIYDDSSYSSNAHPYNSELDVKGMPLQLGAGVSRHPAGSEQSISCPTHALGDHLRQVQESECLSFGGQSRGLQAQHDRRYQDQALPQAPIDLRGRSAAAFSPAVFDCRSTPYYPAINVNEQATNEHPLVLQRPDGTTQLPSTGPCIYGVPNDGVGGNLQWFQTQSPPNMMPPNMILLENMNSRPVFELDVAHGVRSKLLHDFKVTCCSGNLSTGRKWELRDVFGHVVEFAGDQAGSKFIQTKLETASSLDREHVFREVLPNSLQLMNDVFGNYVMQRLFQYGDQNQKRILAEIMKGRVFSLSKQVYGCRVLQKALKFSLIDQQNALVCELAGKTLNLIWDMNGNHVIQKIIKHVPFTSIPEIITACVTNLRQLAVHTYGCRVVQRLLEYYKGPLLPHIFAELHECSAALISDRFGNYVMQWIIRKGDPEDRAEVIGVVGRGLLGYARQKFASNVVEKCIEFGTTEQKREIMLALCRKSGSANGPFGAPARDGNLALLIRDSYGNYVIQKLLDQLDNVNDYTTFVGYLDPEITSIRRTAPSKQAENVYKKMLRLEFPHNQQGPPLKGFHVRLTNIDTNTNATNNGPRLLTPTTPMRIQGLATPPSTGSSDNEEVEGSVFQGMRGRRGWGVWPQNHSGSMWHYRADGVAGGVGGGQFSVR